MVSKALSINEVKNVLDKDLKKIEKLLKTEKIKEVSLGETTVNRSLEYYDTITIKTKNHTIDLTLESYNVRRSVNW